VYISNTLSCVFSCSVQIFIYCFRKAFRKILKFTDVEVADDVAAMNNLIFIQGAFAGGVFAGDNFITSSWRISLLKHSGGNSIPNDSLGRGCLHLL
jgi:hypothetical protein